MRATDLSPSAISTSRPSPDPGDRTRGRWMLDTLRRRWPTGLALAAGALNWGVDALTAAQLLPLLPLIYVAVAVVRRPRASWPLLAGSVVYLVVLDLQNRVEPLVGVVMLASAIGLVGLLRRDGRSEVLVQLLGLLLFAGLAVLAMVASPVDVRYLMAAGWLGHGVWDLVHLRRHAVVSRSYAEWCGVFDIMIAVSLLAVR